MAKLLIQTQTHENYGDDVNQYWKPKGGCDYVVKKFRDINKVTEVVMALRGQIECDNEWYRESIINFEIVADDYLTEVVMALRGQIECDNEWYRESIIGWEIVADDYLTEFEKDQLEYEGKIRFPAKELAW